MESNNHFRAFVRKDTAEADLKEWTHTPLRLNRGINPTDAHPGFSGSGVHAALCYNYVHSPLPI